MLVKKVSKQTTSHFTVRLSTSPTLEEVVDDEVDLFEVYTSVTLFIRHLGGLVMRFSFGASKRNTGGGNGDGDGSQTSSSLLELFSSSTEVGYSS
jgi:hypothetical protein